MTIPINLPDSLFLFTGAIIPALRSSAPEGWLLLNGLTIGNAESGASGRANNDTETLFLTLWNSTQAVVVGGRGDTAAADYADHKELVLPDFSGRVPAGKDLVGDVLSGADVLGAILGSQTHELSLSQIPNHRHTLDNSTMFDQNGGTQANAVANAVTQVTENLEPPVLGAAHNNVQPTAVVHWMIKL